MTTRDYHAAAQRIVASIGAEGARELVTLLEASDTARADAFRQLYKRGDHGPLLDALTDLEADPLLRGWLVEHLRLELDI